MSWLELGMDVCALVGAMFLGIAVVAHVFAAIDTVRWIMRGRR
jgi:hypothetical protein